VKGLEEVRRRIEIAGGDPERITIVAVTKGFGADAVQAALAAGLVDVGENYAQELTAKAAAPGTEGARWHFIGRVQRNKVRALAPIVHLWQSVDRAALADSIAAAAPGAAVLVQVDTTGEPQKGGCEPGAVPALVAHSRAAGLVVRGLMAVGPAGAPQAARAGFERVRRLADDLGLPERSMGMSGDLEVAVGAGSTMVRVGTALFGPR
jgi:pyridoxal phosphate enzyme (YggS family)